MSSKFSEFITHSKMTIEPIFQIKFSFKNSALNHLDEIASLDCGSTLAKMIYVDKEDAGALDPKSGSEFVTMTAVLFSNFQIDSAFLYFKEHAYLINKDFPLHATGTAVVKHKEKIKKILNKDVVLVDEMMAQAQGVHFLLKNVPLKDLILPEIKYDCKESFNSSFLKDQFQNARKEFLGRVKSLNIFPCIFGFMGSACGFQYIEGDGSFQGIGRMLPAGKTFMGLCRCILGTNDYNEIIAMASRGDRKNVDSQIKDFAKYASGCNALTADLPIINFGKLAETKKGIKDFNKDDIAHSLVSMFVIYMLKAAVNMCAIEKVSNIFFGGHFTCADIFRKEFYRMKKIFSVDFINFYFLNNGHTAAFGTMLYGPEDVDKFHINEKL